MNVLTQLVISTQTKSDVAIEKAFLFRAATTTRGQVGDERRKGTLVRGRSCFRREVIIDLTLVFLKACRSPGMQMLSA